MIRNALRSFPPGVSEKLGYYVYLYFDPADMSRPFYIGKGLGERVFSHLFQADDPARDGRKVRRIRKIWDRGQDAHIVIQRYGMSECEALNVEAALIDLFPDAENEVAGQDCARGKLPINEVVAHFRASEARIDFPCVVFTLRKRWPDVYAHRLNGAEDAYEKALFNAARARWAVSPTRHPTVKHAVAYADGVIRQVYRIDRWRPAIVDGGGLDVEPNGKFMFDGEISIGHAALVGCALVAEQRPTPGAQTPFRYLNG